MQNSQIHILERKYNTVNKQIQTVCWQSWVQYDWNLHHLRNEKLTWFLCSLSIKESKNLMMRSQWFVCGCWAALSCDLDVLPLDPREDFGACKAHIQMYIRRLLWYIPEIHTSLCPPPPSPNQTQSYKYSNVKFLYSSFIHDIAIKTVYLYKYKGSYMIHQ